MSKENVFVFPLEDGNWKVTREGAKRATSTHDTQQEAWDNAREIAKKDEVEAFLANKKGKFRNRDSYGNDPIESEG